MSMLKTRNPQPENKHKESHTGIQKPESKANNPKPGIQDKESKTRNLNLGN